MSRRSKGTYESILLSCSPLSSYSCLFSVGQYFHSILNSNSVQDYITVKAAQNFLVIVDLKDYFRRRPSSLLLFAVPKVPRGKVGGGGTAQSTTAQRSGEKRAAHWRATRKLNRWGHMWRGPWSHCCRLSKGVLHPKMKHFVSSYLSWVVLNVWQMFSVAHLTKFAVVRYIIEKAVFNSNMFSLERKLLGDFL